MCRVCLEAGNLVTQAKHPAFHPFYLLYAFYVGLMESQGSNKLSMRVSGKPELVTFKVSPETGYGFEPPGPQQSGGGGRRIRETSRLVWSRETN